MRSVTRDRDQSPDAVRPVSTMSRAAVSFASYILDPQLLRSRVLGALERRVLSPNTAELRTYFETVISATTSPFGGGPEDDGVSGASDEDIEQTCLILCHHDADGDGKLSPTEFAAVIDLTANQGGIQYAVDHVERTFQQADIDGSGFIDLNELILLRRRKHS